MKKYSWIVALLLALSLAFVFVGCGDPDDKDKDKDTDTDVEMEWKTVFELATDAGIQALTVSDEKLAFGLKVAAPQPILPIVRAGNEDAHVTVKAVAGPGEQKVALEFTTVAEWGAGLDLLSSAFGFQAGDKITLKGEVKAIGTGGSKPQFQANGKIGGEYTLSKSDGEKASTVTAEAFDWEITLDADAIAQIKTGDSEGSPWPGIRLSGNGKGTVVRIDNIKIEGDRPSALKTLAAPVIELTETGVKWTAVEGAGGYKVFLDAATEPVDTLGSAAISVNLKANPAVVAGTYKVTVIATGETGVSKDSVKSNEVTYVKAPAVALTPGPQTDGSYVIDPTAWESWYGVTIVGNTVKQSGGAAYIEYPDDFDIEDYASLVITYTCEMNEEGTDNKGGVGAKITVKTWKTLPPGDVGGYGDDIAYLGPLDVTSTTPITLKLFDNTNSKWTNDVVPSVAFGIGRNGNDTSDQFTITFETIIFYPAE
jgi:hypothetical protein